MKFFSRSPRHFCRCCLIISFLVLLPAIAAATIEDSQNLRERFNTDSTAADFIFVVNNSSGLSDAGVFAELRVQLSQVVEALSPIDNFILIGFNNQASTIISACPVGDDSLPFQSKIFRTKDPRGPAGSLRHGLEAALNALNRPGHAPLQFLFLIVDGGIATQQQIGATPDTLSWEALTKLNAAWRGKSIAEAHGFVVGNHSDLQITRVIFPDLRFEGASVASLRGFFERWRSELPSRKLRLQLANELADGALTVQPIGAIQFREREKMTELRVRVRSRLRRLSLTLPHIGEWRVFPDELKVTPRYEEFPVTLAPGQSRDLTVIVTREPSEGFFGCWHWRRCEITPAQISFLPAINLVDRAAVRSVGLDEPSPFMHKLNVEMSWQHGQPAWLLCAAIGMLCLMAISVVIARSYGITGTDFAVEFLQRHFVTLRAVIARLVSERMSLSENFKGDLIWFFTIPLISSLTFAVVTLLVLWVTERWLGRIGLGVMALLLIGFWSIVVAQQAYSFLERNTATTVPPSPQKIRRVVPLVKPSLDAIVEE